MIGQHLLHYYILEKLGQGGMGIVYKAEDTKLRRLVALKFLSPDLARNSAARQRFLVEAQAASALNHPNICTIHAVEEVADLPEVGIDYAVPDSPTDAITSPWDAVTGVPWTRQRAGSGGPRVAEPTSFIVMEYVVGTLLSEQISTGPVSPTACLEVARQIAEGLNEAHRHGIIHRDIKPNNLMITEAGLVKIMDFGLAKRMGVEQAAAGSTMGTLAYMSPEQIRGTRVDHRTDLFSLGVVLYELATGRRPFEASDPSALLEAITRIDALTPSDAGADVPRAFEQLIMKCLRKTPDERWASAADLLSELQSQRTQLAEAAVVERSAPRETASTNRESERRHATIMFGEIRWPEEAGDAVESDDWSQAASALMALVMSIAAKYGGTVDRMMGGSFTVLFGLPVATENTPRQALNAAIAIRNAVRAANARDRGSGRFAAHLGVNTGTVLAGAVGTGDDRKYSVLGDTVVLALRLKDRAPDDHIYVGPQTYRQTHHEFTLAPLPALHLKDRKEPFPVFQVLSDGTVEAPSWLDETRGVHTAMVGRDADLARLQRLVQQLLGGAGSIVSVVGEAGVGKSRLLAELLRDDAVNQATVLYGRAVSTGKNLGYHPIVEMLKRWAGIAEGDRRQPFEKLERAIRVVYPAGVDEIFPFVATLLGLHLSGPHAERMQGIEGDALGKLILKSVRDLLEKAATVNPIIVVVEDLHWADQSSVDLLEGILRSAQHNRILFISTFRPGYKDTSDRILETIKSRYGQSHCELPLEPLHAADARQLVEQLLNSRGLVGGIQDRIVSRAGGNPLFIEEIVRSLIDEGAIEVIDGGMRVTAKMEAVVIPDTIQELLIARIDLLDEQARSLLKIAAVIGRNFLHRILEAVTPWPERIQESLDRLIRSQLIRRGSRMGEIEYLFSHALTQESVYETMVPRVRKELHLQVAGAIETIFRERIPEFYGMLAMHYSRGENLQKAEEYLLEAGAEAIKTAASSEAIFYYQEALSIYLKLSGSAADPDRRAQLERNIGLAFYNKGRMVEAVEHFDRALASWRAWRPKGPLATTATLAVDMIGIVWRLYVSRRQPSRAPDARENAIIDVMHKKGTAIVSIDPRRYFVESVGLLRRINRYHLTKVKNGAAIYAATSALFSVPAISFRLSRRILDYVRPFVDEDDPRTMLYYRFSELMLDMLIGRWVSAPGYDRALVDANRKLGEEWFVSVYTVVHAAIEMEKGRFASAEALLTGLGEIGEAFDNALIRARTHLLNTRLLLKRRRLDRARREAEAAAPLLLAIDHPMLRLYQYGLQANVELLRGNEARMREALRAAEDLLASLSSNVPPYYVSSYRVSRLLVDLRDLEAAQQRGDAVARDDLRRMVRAAERAALRVSRVNASDLTEILRLIGVSRWLDNRPTQALTWWTRSRREGERLGATPEIARTYAEVARRLGESDLQWNGLTAAEAAAQARAWFSDLGVMSESSGFASGPESTHASGDRR